MGKTAVNGSISDEHLEALIKKCENGAPRRLELSKAQTTSQDDVNITISDDSEGAEALEAAIEYYIYTADHP